MTHLFFLDYEFQRMLKVDMKIILIITALLFVSTTTAQAQEEFGPLNEQLFTVAGIVPEVSGSVLDNDRNTIWTLTDSGNGPIIGKTSTLTYQTERLYIKGAPNKDWEAILLDPKGFLWIMDVGDNNRKRKFVTLYKVDPELLTRDPITRRKQLFVEQKIILKYSHGPMDCEAAFMSSNKIYFIEKVPLKKPGKAKILAIDLDDFVSSEELMKAKKVSSLPFMSSITDASVSPNGELHVLTYLSVKKITQWETPKAKAKTLFVGHLGQQEALIALGRNKFLVGIEKGIFFKLD